jgi:hypothetical protein
MTETSMRTLLAIALLTAATAAAAQPDTKLPPPVPAGPCADCGVVRSVRTITKELRADPAKSDARPSGLVASVPLGGGGKIEAGSSSKIGKDAPTTSESWEIVIRLDDGRFRILNVTEPPEVQAGDKVRVEANGRISLRTD